MLSLASNPNCLLMDDELNVLPTSSHVKSIAPIPIAEDGRPDVPNSGAEAAAELKDLRDSLADTQVQTPACVYNVCHCVSAPVSDAFLQTATPVVETAAEYMVLRCACEHLKLQTL